MKTLRLLTAAASQQYPDATRPGVICSCLVGESKARRWYVALHRYAPSRKIVVSSYGSTLTSTLQDVAVKWVTMTPWGASGYNRFSHLPSFAALVNHLVVTRKLEVTVTA